MMSLKDIGIALGLTLLLQACGGGGGGGSTASAPTYSGLTTEARIEQANSQSLSTATASGAFQSIAADAASSAFARSTASMESRLLEIAPKIAKAIVQAEIYAAKTTDLSDLCDAGGSAIADTNDAETIGTITFSSCAISDGYGGSIVMSGTVDYVYNDAADSIAMTFNVVATYAGDSVPVNMILNCVNFVGGPTTCSVTSDFPGLDGRIYRIESISVSGNETTGFYVGATVYDPDHGYVTLSTTAPLTFNCGNSVPDTGSVSISGADTTSATITFVSCSEYNVTISGLSTPYNWP